MNAGACSTSSPDTTFCVFTLIPSIDVYYFVYSDHRFQSQSPSIDTPMLESLIDLVETGGNFDVPGVIGAVATLPVIHTPSPTGAAPHNMTAT
jgi:phosphoribosylcarboxyaminoimidazole (NCAIR) mutase